MIHRIEYTVMVDPSCDNHENIWWVVKETNSNSSTRFHGPHSSPEEAYKYSWFLIICERSKHETTKPKRLSNGALCIEWNDSDPPTTWKKVL